MIGSESWRVLEQPGRLVFLICYLIYFFGLYAPRMRNIKGEKVKDQRISRDETIYSFLAFTGMQIIPMVYCFAPWLDRFEYRLPVLATWLGGAVFVAALLLVWRAHADLGRNWSPTLQIKSKHELVTEGIFRYVRHPIYASQFLWGIAQALLLQNWIAGLAGLATFLPVYLYRVPREEQMMIDHFGDKYRAYMQHTGRVLPRVRG